MAECHSITFSKLAQRLFYCRLFLQHTDRDIRTIKKHPVLFGWDMQLPKVPNNLEKVIGPDSPYIYENKMPLPILQLGNHHNYQ